MQQLNIDRVPVAPKNRLFTQFSGWFFLLAFIAVVGAFKVGAFLPKIVLPGIGEWWSSHPSTPTKRVTVAYPDGWASGEYRNCHLEDLDGNQWLMCASQPGYSDFVMDVRFSGDDKNQSWTCQNDGRSLICRNVSAISENPAKAAGKFLTTSGATAINIAPPLYTLNEPPPGQLYVRTSDGQLWLISADKLLEAHRLDPGLHGVDGNGW